MNLCSTQMHSMRFLGVKSGNKVPLRFKLVSYILLARLFLDSR